MKHLKLFRDTYYTAAGHEQLKAPGDAELTMFVQPGHYLCLGDNSTQSSDGRDLGHGARTTHAGQGRDGVFPVLAVCPPLRPDSISMSICKE